MYSYINSECGSDEESDAGGSFEMMVLKSVMPVVNIIGIETTTSPIAVKGYYVQLCRPS